MRDAHHQFDWGIVIVIANYVTARGLIEKR